MNPVDREFEETDFVTQIHSVLAVRYGAGWAKMWQGLTMHYVREDWRRVLREFETNAVAVAYALDNLPVGPRPPTATEFLQLCEAAPRPAMRLLQRAGSRPSAQQLRVMQAVTAARQPGGSAARSVAMEGWQRILARIEAGEQVTPTVRRWAKDMERLARGVACQ